MIRLAIDCFCLRDIQAAREAATSLYRPSISTFLHSTPPGEAVAARDPRGRNVAPARESDSVEPEQAYPASKVAAEKVLRDSALNWSILRFPFVYGDADGHLQMLPKHISAVGFHPANRMSTIHHRDIAAAVILALAGLFDGSTVNISDDAPTMIDELVGLVGERMDSSSEPMRNPWFLHVDASLARSLGFQPAVRTVYQAAQEGIL